MLAESMNDEARTSFPFLRFGRNAALIVAIALFGLVRPLAGQFLYVANFNSDHISTYRIHPTGVLTPVGTPVSPAAASLVIEASGRFLYGISSSGVLLYRIEADGRVTPIGSAASGSGFVWIVTHPSARLLYAFRSTGGPDTRVSTYLIGPSGGLTPVGSPLQLPFYDSPTIDAAGSFFYTAGGACVSSGGVVQCFGGVSVNGVGASGLFTTMGTLDAGMRVQSVAVHPTGRFLYLVGQTSGRGAQCRLAAMNIDPAGHGTPIKTDEIGCGPSLLVMDPAGNFLFSGGHAYSIASTGAMTLTASTALSANGPVEIFDPTGSFLFVPEYVGDYVNYRVGDYRISTFSVGANGALTFVASTPTGDGGHSMVVSRAASETTPPVILPSLIGTAGSNGWYTSDVKLNWSVTDPESGIASSAGCTATTLTSDTRGTTVTCLATNGAGLNNSVSVTIKIDKSPPNIGCAANPNTLWPPNGKPATVTVSGTMTDATSGPESGSLMYAITDEYGQVQPKGPGVFGRNGSYSFGLPLVADRNGSDKDGRKYVIVVSGKDTAGNAASCSSVVTVPHDRGR